jgi:hypothetical protein
MIPLLTIWSAVEALHSSTTAEDQDIIDRIDRIAPRKTAF